MTTPLLYQLRSFLTVSFLGWLFAATLLVLYGYENSFLLVNGMRLPFLDWLMPHYTHLGDGFVMSVWIGFLFARKNPAMIPTMIIGMLLVALFTYVGKHWIFTDWERPVLVFLHRIEFYEIPLKRLFHHTFPSGHSMAAGAMCTYLAFAVGKRWWLGALVGLLSLSIAYSRIYIGVHFLGDTLAGHMTGVFLSLLVLWQLYPRIRKWMEGKSPDAQKKWQKGNWILVWSLLPISIGWLIYSEYL